MADERAPAGVPQPLGNAIKFTPQGGEIWLKVGWTASGGQYLSVKDSRAWDSGREIPIVLASFGQGSNSIKSPSKARASACRLPKNLVELHGGPRLRSSRKLRIGTEVVVTFPSERVMSALAPILERSTDPAESNVQSKPRVLWPAARLAQAAVWGSS